MDEKIYPVTGMTCAHCVDAVTREVTAVPGVSSALVDLEAGTVRVTGHDVSDEEVGAAVEEAGYAVS